jgi:hypothetical protein
VVSGRKTIEVRMWSTGYRGPIWVHAAQKRAAAVEDRPPLDRDWRGGLIGVVQLEAVVPFDSERWELWRAEHLDPGPFPAGAFAWVLGGHLQLKTLVPFRGHLKLFALPTELVDSILAENPELCKADVTKALHVHPVASDR